jgi:hypothetical protein
MAKASLDLIKTMHDIAEVTQPITGRGVGYKLFSRGLITSMGRKDMKRVYRLLKEAREQGIIPWEIVCARRPVMAASGCRLNRRLSKFILVRNGVQF